MRHACSLLFACLLFLPCAEGAAPRPVPHTETATIAGLPVTVQNGFVDVIAGHNETLSHDALTPFTAVLKAYPRANSFDLSWDEPALMSGSSADVGYDRRRHTVTVDYYWGGGDDPEHHGKVVFTQVAESVFAAILQAHPKGLPQGGDPSWKPGDDPFAGDDAGEWGGFQYLFQPRYGCHVLAPPARHKRHHSRHVAR